MKVPPLHRDGNKCALDGQSCVGGGHPRATLSSKMRRGGACVPARTSAQRRFHTGNRFVYHALCAGGRMMDAPLWSDTGGHTGIAPTHLHHIFPHIPHKQKNHLHAIRPKETNRPYQSPLNHAECHYPLYIR